MHKIAATGGLIDSQRSLKVARWLGIQKGQRTKANGPRPIMLWQLEKVPDIGSGAVGTGNGVGATFNALPQLAAEAKGSGCAKGRQGAGGGSRRWCREGDYIKDSCVEGAGEG